MPGPPGRDVLVVGDINLDVLVRPVRPIEHGTDVAADIRQRPGGAGANVAWGLARLGVSTTLAGCIGASGAHAVTDPLRAAGVALEIRSVVEARTGVIVAIIGPDGERSMASDRGANLAVGEADIPETTIAKHRHLHVSGYLMFDPGTRQAALSAIGRARKLGRTVSVDPSSVAPLRAYGVAAFLADISGVDLLLPNADEARALSATAEVEAAAGVLASAFPVVAVTCGAGGALWADAGGVLRRPVPFGPVALLDTTGAGDAFTAGLLAAWLAGRSPTSCLDAGLHTAAEVIGRWGAR